MRHNLTVGKETILGQVKAEMQLRSLDPTPLVFKWVDDGGMGPLLLYIFRGKLQRNVRFSRADVEDWAATPGLYGKYSYRVLEATNRLLQEG